MTSLPFPPPRWLLRRIDILRFGMCAPFVALGMAMACCWRGDNAYLVMFLVPPLVIAAFLMWLVAGAVVRRGSRGWSAIWMTVAGASFLVLGCATVLCAIDGMSFGLGLFVLFGGAWAVGAIVPLALYNAVVVTVVRPVSSALAHDAVDAAVCRTAALAGLVSLVLAAKVASVAPADLCYAGWLPGIGLLIVAARAGWRRARRRSWLARVHAGRMVGWTLVPAADAPSPPASLPRLASRFASGEGLVLLHAEPRTPPDALAPYRDGAPGRLVPVALVGG